MSQILRRMSRSILLLICFSVVIFNFSCSTTSKLPVASGRVQGVRFDPSYYYSGKKAVESFVDSITTDWQAHGINTVFFKAYDPEYGAVYHTSYKFNHKIDYGKKDFMRIFLNAAHKNNIRFIVWLPVLEHKGAWEANPQWRIKNEDGADLVPFPKRYFICDSKPEVRQWWNGFIKDIISRYPDIDGVDLAEPTVVWKGTLTCSCDDCKKQFGTGKEAFSPGSIDLRASQLTDLLISSCSLIHNAGKTTCVTVIPTADHSAHILPFSAQKKISGLDIDKLLDSQSHPDWISLELMWQQWADCYDDPANFNPAWTKSAVEQVFPMVAGRAHVITHVELTPLGPVDVTPGELAASIVAARKGGAQSIEVYDSHLADSLKAWEDIGEACATRSDKRAFVLYDPDGLGLARQIGTLFGHFDLQTRIVPVDSFASLGVTEKDLVAYLGSKTDTLPEQFLSYAGSANARLLWMNLNLSQVPNLDSLRGFHFKEVRYSNKGFPTVIYKGKQLFKNDSVMTITEVRDTNIAKVRAWALDKNGNRYPYAIKSGNFWYVADCPVDYMEEGCRHIVVADLLHEFTGEDHPENHTALVRIEDVCALSDPRAIRRIADVLSSEKVPFAISLVPFYVDPQENTAISLSDRPHLVDALHYAVSRGAAIVMHGSTHQYRGRTTADYEFWDAVKNGPLFEDSDEYVRVRIQRGLDELHKEGLYPVTFETPHYAASQRDYVIVNQFFSAENGRRQVIDKKGFDQLVPYLIYHHPDGTMIIPENLGYIPTDKQNARSVLRFADNNLAVRDGFASFFFHPWISKKVLRDLIRGIKKEGYQFSDIRLQPLKVTSPDFVQTTGSGKISLDCKGKIIHSFILDRSGHKHNDWYSEGPVNEAYTRDVKLPPGSIFVAEGMNHRHSFFSGFSGLRKGIMDQIKGWFFSEAPLKPPQGQAAHVLVLWNDSVQHSSQSAFYNAFRDYAIPTDTIAVQRFFRVPDSVNLVVVPATSAGRLSNQQSLMLAQAVAAGGNIILEGPSDVAENVGIRAKGPSKVVQQVRDEYFPSLPAIWKEHSACCRFEADVKYVTQYSSSNDIPVVAGGEYGDGMYLFFAAPFADSSGNLSNRFPFFLDMIERQFDVWPVARKAGLEVYFDPGTRAEIAPEELVRMWRENGVRIVHTAAWIDQVDFDYGHFVDLLHRNGMLGYAWFTLPFVSEKFWAAHPQWREVTAAGTSAHIGWRYLMNMTNDTCRAGAFNAFKRYLSLADWDGVNVSGKMFEGNRPDSAALVTPMHPSVRAAFVQQKGYDPVLIFDNTSKYSFRKSPDYWNEFNSFRDSLEQATINQTIAFLKHQRVVEKPGCPIILTRSASADDTTKLVPYWQLADSEKNVRIQLSPVLPGGVDAAELCAYVKSVKENHPSWDPMVELDLDSIRPKSHSTVQLCGDELAALVSAASVNHFRLALRNEENIFDVDFKALPFAAAAPSAMHFSKGELSFDNTSSVALDLDEKSTPFVTVDGTIWPVYNRGVPLLPNGSHILASCSRFKQWRSVPLSALRVLDFSGSVREAHMTVQGLRLSYETDLSTPMVLSQKALSVSVDGLPCKAVIDSGTVVMLPAGVHDVSVVSRSVSGSVLQQASIGLSGAIIVVSTFTISVFLILYIGTLVLRRVRKPGSQGTGN